MRGSSYTEVKLFLTAYDLQVCYETPPPPLKNASRIVLIKKTRDKRSMKNS